MIIRRSTEAKTYTVVIITERSAVRVVSGKELTWCSVGHARAGAMLCHFQIDAAFLVAENRIAAAMIDLQTLRLHFAVTITSSACLLECFGQRSRFEYNTVDCVCAEKIKTWATECVFEPVLKSSNVCDWHLQERRQRWCKQGGFSAILFGKIKFSLLKVYQQAPRLWQDMSMFTGLFTGRWFKAAAFRFLFFCGKSEKKRLQTACW